jgi:hypothetical protein
MAEKRSRFKALADKLAVEAEPGLTATQLMVCRPQIFHILLIEALTILRPLREQAHIDED